MAEKAKVQAFKNKSQTCKVGRDPQYRTYAKPSKFDEAFITNICPGGEMLFMGPGDIVINENGTLGLVFAKGHEFFVECHDEAEADRLNVPAENRVVGQAGSNWPGKLVGFYGAQYVMEDVSGTYVDAIANAGNRIASIKRTKELENQAAQASALAKQKEDENAALRSQLEALQRQASERRGK